MRADVSLDQPGYFLRRYFVDEFYLREASAIRRGSRVLDLGGTKILKRGRFDIEDYGLNVVYVNLSPTKKPDVIADATALPLADGLFDVVICSELLEHVREPVKVLAEAHRVLRPGGRLLVCVPFLYRIHGDPNDYSRHTDWYWRLTLGDIGFVNVTIERQGLFFAVLADFLKQYVSEVGFKGLRGKLARAFVPRFQKWALRRETVTWVRANEFVSSFTTGFGITADRGTRPCGVDGDRLPCEPQ